MTISRFTLRVVIFAMLCAVASPQEKSPQSAPSSLNQTPDPTHGEAEAALQRALHFADLYNWHASRPYFVKAQQLFEAAGDKRNALYARLGAIRGEQIPPL